MMENTMTSRVPELGGDFSQIEVPVILGIEECWRLPDSWIAIRMLAAPAVLSATFSGLASGGFVPNVMLGMGCSRTVDCGTPRGHAEAQGCLINFRFLHVSGDLWERSVEAWGPVSGASILGPLSSSLNQSSWATLAENLTNRLPYNPRPGFSGGTVV